MKNRVSVLLSITLFGCGGDALLPPSPPPPPPGPHALTVVSGNGQQGTSGAYLSEPFVVRVIDASGAGLAGVPVRWTLVSGSGGFGVSSPITVSATHGLASMSFRPISPGMATVAAEVQGINGPLATFTADVTGPAVVVIRFGPLFDCYGTPVNNDPSRFLDPADPVPVGAVVEFEYMEWVHPACTAQVRSVAVPPGGVPFASGILGPGQRFGFVPNVAGDWKYEDVLNGGSGTLKVR